PDHQRKCDSACRQNHATLAVGKSISGHDRHVRTRRHGEKQRDPRERDQLAIDHLVSGRSNDISYMPPLSLAWWIQPIFRSRPSISLFSGSTISEKVLISCARPTRASSVSSTLPRPRRWNSSITATATSATSVPPARS